MPSKAQVIIPLQGIELLDRVLETVRSISEQFFGLGQYLYEVKHAEVYKSRDYGSWAEYCSAELPFEWRTADHYVAIWEKLSQKLGYEFEDVKHIGWSKLSRVVNLIDSKKDAKKWLKTCEKHSKRELEELVKQENARRRAARGGPERPPVEIVDHDIDIELEGGSELDDDQGPFVDPSMVIHDELEIEDEETGESVPLHKFQVFLFAPQWANVMAAMERASQLSNSEKACNLIDLIALEFNTTYAETDDGGVAHRLDYHIKNLERIFGVSISVDVPKDSTLREMSRLNGSPLSKAIRKPKRTEDKPKKTKEKPQHHW